MSEDKEQRQLEIAKKIIEQGNCDNILCWAGSDGQFPGIECPFNRLEIAGCASKSVVQLAENYVEEYNKKNQPESPWRPIETAPKDGRDILVGIKKWSGIGVPLVNQVFYSEEAGRFLSYYHNAYYKVEEATHWMPISELPEVSR